MSDVKVHKVQPAWKKNALIDNETYLKWYADSVKNPDKFWGKHGKRIDWMKPFTKVRNASFNGKVSIKWYEDGQLSTMRTADQAGPHGFRHAPARLSAARFRRRPSSIRSARSACGACIRPNEAALRAWSSRTR